MTDLTAYEQALVERVARALCEGIGFDPDQPLYEDDDENLVWHEYTADAKAALAALGLIGPSRTHWLAPWEASEDMQDEATAAFDDARLRTRAARERRNDKLEADGHGRPIDEGLFCGADWTPAVFAAMRDAHLKEGGA